MTLEDDIRRMLNGPRNESDSPDAKVENIERAIREVQASVVELAKEIDKLKAAG